MNYSKLADIDFLREEKEDFEERAAILQFEGGYSKEEAEKRAYMMILSERDAKHTPSHVVIR